MMPKFNTTIVFTTFILSVVIFTVSCQGCGKKHNSAEKPFVDALIVVGGHDAALGEYPWQVSLQYQNGDENVHFCGGSIVADKWVLTAAHCFTSGPFAKRRSVGFDAVAGIVDRLKTQQSEQRIAAVDYFINEYFNESMGQNDIALVELDRAYDFGNFVEQICLPESMQETIGTATVTGWGSTSQEGPFSEMLQQLDMTIITNNECINYYPNKIVKSMLCVRNGGGSSYTGPCSGDSGGPLVSINPSGDSYYLSGVVSWGDGCVDNFPAVLMKVSYYIDWINTIMNE